MNEKIEEDNIVVFLRNESKKNPMIKRVILFGSRARGDETETSDYDFAFEVKDGKTWSQFALNISEKAPTLKKLDLIRLDEADDVLKRRIDEEGVIIYESQ